MQKAMGVLSIVLALGACSKPAAPVTNCGPDCVAAINRVLPKNMPAYAQIYNGGWVDSATSFANGGVITYTVPAKPDDLARFYDGAAGQGTLTRTFDNNAWGGSGSTNPASPRVLIYGQSGTSRTLYVNLDNSEPGFTRVALVYGAP